MLTETKDRYTFAELVEIMARLLADRGCPWDRQQTLESLKSYLLEETYEVLEAIDEGDPAHHREELGDLLFQVVFQAALREREGSFDISGVVTSIAQKLVRRHPHVFGDERVDTAGQVRDNWIQLKREEAAQKDEPRRTLDGVPRALPALLRAQRIQQKAAGVGFDWEQPQGARDKLTEELAELDEAVAQGDPAAVRHELGDLLMATVNFSRLLGLDAEGALTAALGRFDDRFRYLEDRVAERSQTPDQLTLDELEELWVEAKNTLPTGERPGEKHSAHEVSDLVKNAGIP
ncbi:MAG: nucleoside triphosphate pyrophosphohydrolase [bacterium]